MVVPPKPFTKVEEYYIKTRKPWIALDNFEEKINQFELRIIGEAPKSGVGVPLLVGGEVTGLVTIQNVDREHAFSESDISLLETLANSMSVALENARLFEETQQRNAELAIINSVQAGLASKLDTQGIYELVGERLHEYMDTQVASIVVYDRVTNMLHYPYFFEKGDRVQVDPHPLDARGFTQQVLKSESPFMVNQDLDRVAKEMGLQSIFGEMSKAYLGVPLVIGGHVGGVLTVQNMDHGTALMKFRHTLTDNTGQLDECRS